MNQHPTKDVWVCVLGAGVIGLSTAQALRSRGYSVFLLSAAPPSESTSNGAGGFWEPFKCAVVLSIRLTMIMDVFKAFLDFLKLIADICLIFFLVGCVYAGVSLRRRSTGGRSKPSKSATSKNFMRSTREEEAAAVVSWSA